MVVRPFDEIFRDFVTDGIPTSGPHHPYKPDIRDSLNAIVRGAFPDNRVIKLNNANEGTANEIVVSASVDIPTAVYQVLYVLNVTQENTGPVTVSGAINRKLVTNTSEPIPAGYLKPGMAVLCIDTGSELRMLSYGDVESSVEDLVRQAEAALADAEQARDQAQNAASDAVSQGNVPIYSTLASIASLEIPAGINAIRVNGRNAVGDGQGGLYVASDNGSTDTGMSGDGRTWYRVRDVGEERLAPKSVGINSLSDNAILAIRSSSAVSQGSFVQNDHPTEPFGLKLKPKPSSVWDGGICQGLTFDRKNGVWFTSWDNGNKVIMRHDINGNFINASSSLDSIMGHGQDLNHFYDDGTLTLVFENASRTGIVFATPHTSEGGSLGDIREYVLLPQGWSVCWPNVSQDGRFIVAGMITPEDTVVVRVYDISDILLNGPGNYSDKFLLSLPLVPSDEYKGGSPEYSVVQGVAMDATGIYVLTGDSGRARAKYISRFDVVTGKREYRTELTTGREFAYTRNSVTYELEGIEWITGADGNSSLWTAVVMRRRGGVGYDMYAMPLDQRTFGSVNSYASPGGVGFVPSVSADILIPPEQLFQIRQYSGMDNPYEIRFSIDSLGYLYSPRRHLFGTYSNIEPSTTTHLGTVVKSDLGRICASASTVAMQLQSLSGSSQIAQFFSGSTSVGNISVTPSGTSYNQTSDAKFKESNGELSFESAKKILELITIHGFTWTGEYSSGGEDIGAFAQELYDVYPRAVSVGGWFLEDGTEASEGDEGAIYQPWGIDYSKLMPVVIRVIQGVLNKLN